MPLLIVFFLTEAPTKLFRKKIDVYMLALQMLLYSLLTSQDLFYISLAACPCFFICYRDDFV